MEKIVFADLFTKTLKKTLVKIPPVTIDDPIFRLHYKVTGLALLFASILVSGYQFFGNPIMCIQKDDIPEQLLNTYCWIESTFTLPKSFTKEVGTEVVYPGVSTYREGDVVIKHAYYQWVFFVLLLQSLMFTVPYFLWKAFEAGKMKALIADLQNPVLEDCKRNDCFTGVSYYFHSGRNEHRNYAIKFLICEVLNFVNVVAQIFIIDVFLGGEFRKYGADVVTHVNTEQDNRLDPMIKVFPRITKCTFHKYGSSGDVQRHDALCLLPLNILNEKIYVIMWFWFIILAILGGIVIVYRLIAVLSYKARTLLLTCSASLTKSEYIKSLVPFLTYGEWFFLYFLALNIDNLHFDQLFRQLTESLPKKPIVRNPNIVTVKSLDDVDKGYPSRDADESLSLMKDESTV